MTTTFAQEQILLDNPSFEDLPRTGKVPSGWWDCGFPTESEPDIHPSPNQSYFQVDQLPSDGDTYMGMVVRDNDTWEMVGQALTPSFQADKYYHFSINLCRSENYKSPSRITGNEVSYTSPVKLRIWGGDAQCDKAELLAETPLIIHPDWKNYSLIFNPKGDYEYILFECYYKTPTLFPYNGNILLDNASPITMVTEEIADSIAVAEPRIIEGTTERYGNQKKFERLSLSEIDSIDAASRNWGTAGEFTEKLREVFQNMEVDFESDEFSAKTRSDLLGLFEEISFTETYPMLTIGILGKNKRRKMLSLPFLFLIEEPEFAEFDVKIVKVEVGEMDENWVGKNKYYWFRLE